MRIELATGTPAELALPPGRTGGELGLALVTDVMGLRPLFDELCARLASEEGWVVCAPEPFPGREGLAVEERLAAMKDLEDSLQVGDLVAAADVTGCDRVAVLGFCMGGMYAMKAVSTGRFWRAVSFYGPIRVPPDWRGPGQGEPLEALGPGRTPVLALVGGRDPFTPRADVESLRAVEGVTVVEYPEAEHGFVHDPARPAHRPADAADAWQRVRQFLG